MNDELKTKEYFKSMEQIKLSDSSRERIKGDLLQYARFHAVTEVSKSTPIRSPFLGWVFKPMPVALALVLLVGTTTSLLAKGAVPGDFLYALKTGLNENFRGVFAIGTNETVSPTSTTAVHLAEATASDATTTDAHDSDTQTDVGSDSSLAINTRSKFAPESTTDASSDLSTMLSQGTWSIEDYTSDVKLRSNILRDLVKKYDSELQATVKTDFKTKLDSADEFVVEAEGKSESDARANLDKAAVLIGEVEAKLSILGQVIVKDGMIVDVDFNVDLSVPHMEGESSIGDTPKINVDAGGGLGATSGLGL